MLHHPHRQPEQDRLVLALAGLPSLPRKLAEAKSYAERLFTYHTVDALTDTDAATALSSPADTEGVTWHSDAIRHVVTEARGYPYFLQQYGQDTWNNAPGTPINLNDARLGVATGQLALHTGFFRVRWDRATSAEKDYLKAMALDGDRGSASGEVAARLHKKTTALVPVRTNLINKGLIYSPTTASSPIPSPPWLRSSDARTPNV